MIRRNTQTPAYWEKFQVTREDIDHLSNLLVEREVPLKLDDLARALVVYCCREEEQHVAHELSKGTLYLPGNTYEEGEQIVFPLLEYATAQVVAIRDGYNPEHGAFRVIQAQFPGGRLREFAAGLENHPLNDMPPVEQESLRTPADLYQEHGPRIRAVLGDRLAADPGFIQLAREWFLKDLLVEISEGQLNLAEAVLDMAGGGPLPTDRLIGDLDLPEGVDPRLGVFSLNYALQEDARFDEVGPAGEVLWYLRRLEPLPVLDPPLHLSPWVVEYDHRVLDETMLNLERRLDDEWSDLIALPETAEPVTIVLAYPHRRSGTLPISSRLTQVFPTGRTHRIRFLFRDGRTGKEIPGWVVRERRFIYGLEEWYEQNDIPVGAYIDLQQADEPGVVIIRHRPTRPRREWVRVATVQDERLTFEMTPFSISCEYDELMVVVADDFLSLSTVSHRVRRERLSLEKVIGEIFPELAKLSPQGTVHAATLYSAVNVAIRTPPGPILNVLRDQYELMGDNYWVMHGRSAA
ncbi:MAG: hypothetical protein JW900_00045 [Anaerolineae bacterium]|nr:hypothetical protein [Anaerolineae bacterium]